MLLKREIGWYSLVQLLLPPPDTAQSKIRKVKDEGIFREKGQNGHGENVKISPIIHLLSNISHRPKDWCFSIQEPLYSVRNEHVALHPEHQERTREPMRDLTDINRMRVVYRLPHMEQVPVRKDITYKTVNGEALKMDVYYPLDMSSHTPCPAVLLVHGGAQPERVEHIKESAPYVSWGQLIAASGLIAVMFKHRTDEGYTKLREASSDVDDLVHSVRSNAASLQVDAERLCLWAFSQGPLHGFCTALRDTPAYIRCLVAYYGGMSIMNPVYFHWSAEDDDLAKAFSPVYHLRHVDPSKVAPIFIAKAGKDRAFLNEALDEFCSVASERNIPLTFMNHPTGEHGFDVLNDDARTREIIKATLAFLSEHLEQ